MKGRLIVASNRLPVVLEQGKGGDWSLSPGSGGLVTALDPVLRSRQGVWIGWPGGGEEDILEVESILGEAGRESGYGLKGVYIDKQEVDDFYLGFSNQVIWPLFHDFQTQCNFDPRFWETYHAVNRRFAKVIAEEAGPDDFVWVHDFHLMALGEDLRRFGAQSRMGFFLHIPFPPLDLFIKLPWRFEILQSLLQFDLLGFQTARDRNHFVECLTTLDPRARCEGERERRVLTIQTRGREVRAGVFPVSIDFDEFATLAASPEVESRHQRIRAEHHHRKIILGVDRLDYTKGIPHKLAGYRLALHRYPELRERVSLLQLVIPSREDVPQYAAMKQEIERMVGKISGEFSQGGWVPIYYQYGRWAREELVAHYREAAVALVTPLKDGMNLVAKEYCASNLDEDGVLILSEYAGASARLGGEPLMVNPYDVEGVAAAIYRACTMPQEERRERMAGARRRIRDEDIFWWLRTYLAAAEPGDLESFSPVHLYVPTPKVRLAAK